LRLDSSRPLTDFKSEVRNMKRILVVDDSPDTADTMAMLLQTFGHDARTATTGAEALAIAASFRPEIALLDLTMPDMDGCAIARQIRLRPELAATVLVAVTGWDRAEDRQMAREAGFQHHLVKPVGLKDLSPLLE
jgi:CheY-like chemotaxis protein